MQAPINFRLSALFEGKKLFHSDSIAIQAALFVVGLAVLYGGAEGLVRGASSIARTLGIRPLIVGLTVVAFGTSAPEFFVSTLAALRGVSDIAIGNVVGSNIANVGLVLGLSALVFPFAIIRGTVTRELYISIVAAVLFALLCLDGTVGILDGAILLAGIIAFTVFCIIDERRRIAENRKANIELPHGKYSIPFSAVMTIAGLMMLVGGAHLMTESAVRIARVLGVSELAIGLTVVALGTSLPEMGASFVSVMHGEAELSVGNVLGSNIFNLFLVIGGASLFHPLSIAPATVNFQIPVMIGFSIAVILPLLVLKRFDRIAGLIFFSGYLLFVFAAFAYS